jgi:hypothetical protein
MNVLGTHKSSTLVHFSFLKLALQFQKPVQPVSVLFLLSPLSCQSIAVRKVMCRVFQKPVQPDLSPAQPILRPVESPAEYLSEPRTPWWKPVQPVFGPLLPTAASFWPPTLYLFIHFCSLHDFLADQPPNKGIQFTSHTQNRIPFNRLKDP